MNHGMTLFVQVKNTVYKYLQYKNSVTLQVIRLTEQDWSDKQLE